MWVKELSGVKGGFCHGRPCCCIGSIKYYVYYAGWNHGWSLTFGSEVDRIFLDARDQGQGQWTVSLAAITLASRPEHSLAYLWGRADEESGHNCDGAGIAFFQSDQTEPDEAEQHPGSSTSLQNGPSHIRATRSGVSRV